MEGALKSIFGEHEGSLPQPTSEDNTSKIVGVKQCNNLLHANLQNRDSK